MTEVLKTPNDEDRYREEAVAAWLTMARLVNWAKREGAERLRPTGLSLAQFDVIAQVGAYPGITQQELAEKTLSTQGNISQLLNGMLAHGLIQRQTEGRSKYLSLTEKGRALYEELVPFQETWHAERFAALTDEELAELLRVLRKLERTYP